MQRLRHYPKEEWQLFLIKSRDIGLNDGCFWCWQHFHWNFLRRRMTSAEGFENLQVFLILCGLTESHACNYIFHLLKRTLLDFLVPLELSRLKCVLVWGITWLASDLGWHILPMRCPDFQPSCIEWYLRAFGICWRVFMGRALKFQIFLRVKIRPWGKSKNRAPFLAESAKELLTHLKPQLSKSKHVQLSYLSLFTPTQPSETIWLVGERCYLIGWASIGWFIGGVSLTSSGNAIFSQAELVVALLVRLLRRHPPESSFIVLHRHDDVSNCERREVSLLDASKRCGASYESAKCLEYRWPASTWREWRSCSYDSLQSQRWYIGSFRSHVSLLDGSFKSKEKSERAN